MKNRLVTLAILLIALPISLFGETLRFVYIAHDVDTPVDQLVQKIEQYAEDLINPVSDVDDTEYVILYLSSSSNPIITIMKSGDTDSDNLEQLVGELYERNFHQVETDFDAEKIIDLLDKHDFLDQTGKFAMKSVKFDFYVTTSFWTMHQNESLIAKLFYVLDAKRFCDTSGEEYERGFSYSVYFPTKDAHAECVENNNSVFGEWNIDNIDNLVKSMIYQEY